MGTENVDVTDEETFGPPDPEQLLKTTRVRIPGQEYLTYEIELTSIRPGLLMNRLDPYVLAPPGEKKPRVSAAATGVKGKKKGVKIEGNIVEEGENIGSMDPAKAYKAARKVAYCTDKNVLYCPSENIQAMALAAGKSWAKTGLDRSVGACMLVEDYQIPFLDPSTDQPIVFPDQAPVVTNQFLKEYPSNVCLLVKPASAAYNKKILTSRVFLPDWKLRFRVNYDASMIDEKAAKSVIRTHIWIFAGSYIGQMSWRPGAPKGPGPFGRFQVTKYARVD